MATENLLRDNQGNITQEVKMVFEVDAKTAILIFIVIYLVWAAICSTAIYFIINKLVIRICPECRISVSEAVVIGLITAWITGVKMT